MSECKHKWIDMEDGSNDQFCVKCSLKQMQAVMTMPIAEPILRETMSVQTYGKLFEVDKENFINELNKSLGIRIKMNGLL